MAQTTGGMSFANPKLEAAPDSAGSPGAYVEYTGQMSTVEVGGGERMTGSQHTGEGDVPILTAGKREVITITVGLVYTEITGEFTEFLRTKYESGDPIYIRWSPTDQADSGDHIYTTAKGYVKTPPYPGGDVGSADPVMIEFDFETTQVTKSEVA